MTENYTPGQEAAYPPVPEQPVANVPQPYPTPAVNPYGYAQPKQSNPLAIVGLVLSLVSILCLILMFVVPVFLWIALLTAIAGLILSIVGTSQAKRLNDAGRGMGIAGTIVSAIVLVLIIILFVLAAAFIGSFLSQF